MKKSPLQRAKWFWHRLGAMSWTETATRLLRKLSQTRDRFWQPDLALVLEPFPVFPRLPKKDAAPESLVAALRRDSANIRRGAWLAFGHLPLTVDDPPQWHRDYAAQVSVPTQRSAFSLNHRSLPEGADIKLIWELSRWNQLVRLAQASWVLGDDAAGQTVLRWLNDWAEKNRPYQGWNWTSALETGIRLIQYSWIDALLGKSGGKYEAALVDLRAKLLPAHVRYTWRYRSVGSSANNHLLGELAGLIVATVRWPGLARWAAPLDTLQAAWEKEVMDQFAGDGGNREQALNYQLFAWEFSWQAAAALEAAGRQVSAAVQERLLEALRFFATVQMPEDPWDYGDSDNAVVTPFALDERRAMNEWYQWATAQSPALQFWWPRRPKMPLPTESSLTDRYFSESGMVIRRTPSQWTLRWDVSPLGYLAPAAHGHLDALHLSLWYRGIAMVVDPGTGAYYADADLRQYLASREAHNGPAPCDFDFPKRVGPFLWARHHEKPSFCRGPSGTMAAEAQLPVGTLRRVIAPWRDGDGWQVEDRYSTPRGGGDFGVHWQFPPDSVLEKTGEREFRLRRRSISLRILIGNEGIISAALEPSGQELWLGTVSPAFRIASWGPYLHLTGHGGEKPCVLRTTFLASRSS